MNSPINTKLAGSNDVARVGRLRAFALRAGSLLQKDVTLALFDQAIVSGTSFLTTILVFRAATQGNSELGRYQLGTSLVLFATVVLESLIAGPFAVLSRKMDAEGRRHYAGSTLIHTLAILIAAVPFVTLASVVFAGIEQFQPLSPVVGVLAMVLPLVMLREYARRFCFARLSMREVVAIDLAVAVLQLATLAVLFTLGILTAVTAWLVIGTVCGVGAITWLILSRSKFVLQRENLKVHWGQSWAFGKWNLSAKGVNWLHDNCGVWLAAMFLAAGVAATGAYTKCQMIVQFSNPIILGLGNILGPLTARAFVERGASDLRRTVGRMTCILGGAMICFWLLLLVGGTFGLKMYGDLQPGDHFVMMVLVTAYFAAAIGIGFNAGLQAMERTEAIFRVCLVAMLVTVGVTAVLLKPFGLVGAAIGLLAGNLTGGAGRAIAFWKLSGEYLKKSTVESFQDNTNNALDDFDNRSDDDSIKSAAHSHLLEAVEQA